MYINFLNELSILSTLKKKLLNNYISNKNIWGEKIELMRC